MSLRNCLWLLYASLYFCRWHFRCTMNFFLHFFFVLSHFISHVVSHYCCLLPFHMNGQKETKTCTFYPYVPIFMHVPYRTFMNVVNFAVVIVFFSSRWIYQFGSQRKTETSTHIKLDTTFEQCSYSYILVSTLNVYVIFCIWKPKGKLYKTQQNISECINVMGFEIGVYSSFCSCKLYTYRPYTIPQFSFLYITLCTRINSNNNIMKRETFFAAEKWKRKEQKKARKKPRETEYNIYSRL